MMMLFVMAAVLSIAIIFTHSAILSVVIFACMVCAESMTYALMNDIQNESIDGTPRASTLSLYSLFQHLGMFFTGVSFGVAADHSLTATYGLSASIYILTVCQTFLRVIFRYKIPLFIRSFIAHLRFMHFLICFIKTHFLIKLILLFINNHSIFWINIKMIFLMKNEHFARN